MSCYPGRDNQRSRLYRAERRAFGDAPDLPSGYSIEDCRRYVEHVTASEAWRAIKPYASTRPWPIRVEEGRGNSASAHAWRGDIRMSRYLLRCRWALLHELAHMALPSSLLAVHIAPHGLRFAAFYLYLVREFMGEEAHAKLREAFEAEGVKVAPLEEAVVDWCHWCSREVEGTVRKKFCSDRCRTLYHNRARRWASEGRRKEHYARRCAACGAQFTPKRSDAETCSARCRKRLSRNGGAPDYPYVWVWHYSPKRELLGERYGQRVRVLARGKKNSAALEFEDGYRVITARGGLRKAAAFTRYS